MTDPVWNSVIVLGIAAIMIAAAAVWVLRAYRRAGADQKSARVALVACAAVGVAALGAYIATGRPELPGAPYQARLAALSRQPLLSLPVDEALAVLAQKAKESPADPMPHLASGEFLLASGRAQEAARAFDAALRREPRQVAAMLGLGESLVMMDGRFTPESIALFEQAGLLTNDPAPWVYQAMAATEQGRSADARRLWREAYIRMPEDDPMREQVRRAAAGR